MNNFFKKYYWVVFSVIAIILIYPSFTRGYIFALDWTIRPFIAWSDIVWSKPLGWSICDILAIVMTFEVFQRVLLFAMITLTGVAGFRLAKNTRNIFAQYFAGLFLIFNPFFYARMLEQTMLIGAGIVSFFWFWAWFKESIEEGNDVKKLIYSALAGALAISFFAHSIFFVASVFVVLSIVAYARKKDWKRIITMTVMFWTIVFAVNGNWIFASFAEGDTWASKVVNFTQDDVEAFKTRKIGGYSVYMTVLSLQGYWGEYQDRFVSVQDNMLWFPAFVCIIFLVFFGLVRLWRKSIFVKPFVFLFLLAFVLAIGVASPLVKPWVLWLYQHVPFYIGLREPQKWVVIMVVVYAFLGAWGIKYILDIDKVKKYRWGVGVLCAILPVIFSFSVIRGMHEYFTPHDFPLAWQSARVYLQSQQSDGKILFLPWHSYMKFDFAGKNITNPAKAYFGKNVISGNNVEFGGVYSNFTDAQTQTIQRYVLGAGEGADFHGDMVSLGIETIIVAKVEDWQTYVWMGDAIGVQKVMENDALIIYRVDTGAKSE
ncbi:MAG: hypothetical protein WC819_01015 [Parcubacteria group bacterium]|jgi:hypothetical protein